MKRIWILMSVAIVAATVSRGATNYCLQLPGPDSAMTTPVHSYGERLGDFTVSARVLSSQIFTGSTQMIAERGLHPGSLALTKFALGIAPSNRPVFLFGTLDGKSYTIRSDIPLRTDRWSHVAATYDHASNMGSLYVDGKIAAARQITEGSVPELWTASTTLGAHNSTPTNAEPTLDQFFQGAVDEVQIWDGAFTQAQVASNRYVKPAGTESNLVAYWNFDDQTPRDATTNGMDGTLRGDAQIVPRSIACDPSLALSCEDRVLFRFQSLPDTPYAIEYCTNLLAGTWTNLQDAVAGDGGIIQIEDTAGVNAGRFYRAKAPPNP